MTVCRLSKTASLLLVFLLTIPMLTGCWDRQEIEERAVVLGIGIDTADPEEKKADEEISHLKGQIHASDTGMVKVTVQIAVPGRIPLGPGESGGGGGGKRTVWVVDAVGFTIDDAVNALQQRVSPPLFFGHLRIIVVSEAVARLSMQNLNDYFRRNPEVRRLNWMFICKQEASDIMFASPQLERVPSLYLMTTMDQAVKMGRFPNDFLGVFWNASSSKGREGFLPYVELKKEQNIQISGMAYFRGEKLVGISKPIEVPLYMGITGLSLAGGQSFVRVPGTRDYFMYQVRSRKSTKKVRILNGKPVMNVTISLEGNLLSKSNESVQLSNDVIHEIEQQLESQLLTGYQRFIADTQKKGSDIFGFGEYVRAKKPAYWNQHVKTKQAWQDVYKELQVEVKVNIHVRRIGMKAT